MKIGLLEADVVNEFIICKHREYCLTRQKLRQENKMVFCWGEDMNKCQTRKFYDRYGKDYNSLGIGG